MYYLKFSSETRKEILVKYFPTHHLLFELTVPCKKQSHLQHTRS